MDNIDIIYVKFADDSNKYTFRKVDLQQFGFFGYIDEEFDKLIDLSKYPEFSYDGLIECIVLNRNTYDENMIDILSIENNWYHKDELIEKYKNFNLDKAIEDKDYKSIILKCQTNRRYCINHIKKICKLSNYIIKKCIDIKNINDYDKYGFFSALQFFCKKNNKEIVEFLIKNNVEINHQTTCSSSSLVEACQENNKDIVEILIKNGAKINSKDCGGFTALIRASQKGCKDIVELLIKNGAEINIKTEDGKTALMWATLHNNKDLVEFLIKNGANVDAKDNQSQTALIIASKFGYKDLVEILINNGADGNAKDNKDKTALDWAIIKGHENIVELLNFMPLSA